MHPLLRRLLAAPARAAMAGVAALTAAPLLLGLRYQGRDHTLVQLGFTCAHRDPGRLVLDPALGGGGPVLQDPLGQALYPATWLLRPLPPELAASLYVVLHLSLAAGSAALLARELGGSRRAALATGLAFALCGTVVDLPQHGPFLCAAVWLPLGWAGARDLLSARSPWAAAALGGSVGMLVLGGEPQSALMLALVTAVEVGASMTRRAPMARRVRGALWVAGAGVAGALLAAAQVLATLGLRAATARAAGVGVDARWALDALKAFALVVPVSLTADAAHGGSLLSAWSGERLSGDLWNATPYLGALVLVGATVGAAVRTRGTAALVGFTALALAVGARLQVLPLLARVIPPLGLFRYPEKYLTLASLGLVVVAVHTWSLARRAARVRAALQRVLGVALAGLVALLVASVVRRGAIEHAAAQVSVPALRLADLPALSTLLTSRLAFAVGVAAVGAMLLRAPRRAGWVLALLVGDLALFAAQTLPLGPSVLAVRSPYEAALPPGAMVCHGIGRTPYAPVVPGFTEGVHRGAVFNRVELRQDVHQCTGVAAPNFYLPSAQYPTLRLAKTLLDASTAGGVQVARALGCTHVLVAHHAHDALVPVPEGAPHTRLFAVPDPLPGASVARRPVRVARLRETFHALLQGGGAADAVRWLDDPLRGAPLALPAGDGVREAAVTWRGATEGTLTAQGVGGAVLVVRRPWWPGWTATQRGRPLPTLRAAGTHLAVVSPDVNAGPITLRYRVWGLGPGAGLSALGLVTLGALVRALARRRYD
ncbi:MAG: hypothetical protein U0325_00965 [Polyangiales bacterium]